MNAKVQAAFNDQIAKEFYAAHLYLSMAAYFDTQSLTGFASWMRAQSDEERMHAVRLFDFVLENGGKVKLSQIDAPPTSFKGALACMEASLRHEQKVTASITKIYELAVKEKDYPAQIEMQWFISEQVEEESTVGDIVARLKLGGDSGAGLLMMDSAVGQRPGAAVPDPQAEG